EAQVGLGDLAGALAVYVAVNDGDKRLGADANRRIDDLQFSLCLRNFEMRLILPGEVDVAEFLPGEGDGRAARSRVELGHITIELGDERTGIVLGTTAAEHAAPRGEETQLAVARCLRVGRNDADARTNQVRPVADLFGVSLAD